jgi:glycosyltransferase involved in cell wall biosynthesis
MGLSARVFKRTRALGRKRSGLHATPRSLPQPQVLQIHTNGNAPHADLPGTGYGVNLIGYLRTENGVGQSARNAIDGLAAAGIPYRLENIRSHGLSEGDRSVSIEPSESSYGINLYIVNADQTDIVASQTTAFRAQERYNIATWVWELPTFPAEWDSAYTAYDEIWAPSTYCQAAFARRSPIPVVHIPYVVRLPEASGLGRDDFGLAPDSFVFLSVFDLRSVFERKNPLGVIDAFSCAFSSKDNCELVIKVNHADAEPDSMEKLRRAAAGKRIRLLDRTWPHADLMSLMSVSDCVVSLHRAEGFGFVMAEAMLLGKPVIATSFSGNMDFTHSSNSFLVGYNLRNVGPDCPPYDPAAVWADPSMESAVSQMRLVHSNATLRAERAIAGQTFLSEHYSAQAVGLKIRERCEWIRSRKGFREVTKDQMEMAL